MNLSEDIVSFMNEWDVSALPIKQIEIENGSITSIVPFIRSQSFQHAIVVVDRQTYRAAGEKVRRLLEKSEYALSIIELEENHLGQVNADEETVMQVFVSMPEEVDVLLAVGAGTIHDIVRFVSSKMKLPFISVPTAASVDGFTSKGAPLILKGVKKTIQTSSPIAVFADLDVLTAAPSPLTAAGFGDMLGKYTSLLDWRISSVIGQEPFSDKACAITSSALQECIDHVEDIAAGTEKGLGVLMEALITSGIVMLILNFSRPASGAEHHLSHYWEMMLLKEDKKQLLHGAKVGAACLLISELYHREKPFLEKEIEKVKTCDPQDKEALQSAMQQLPKPSQLKLYLEKVGGSVSPGELGIEEKLVQESLFEAIHLRERCTGLWLLNEKKSEALVYPLR
ncbi:sn-glycerol-1-phosphate dehydrogenase [Alteribacillus sp. HJP-4]|uniref:sn-glycerol-1-phosphate dehydrogenase n=1 Tax=Alteribacillus sp. HJP-4 TaxID=2775394 RepID=UPI0035CD035A